MERAGAWKERYDKVMEWKDNYERVKNLLDPDERSGQITEEAFGAAIKIAAKVLGVAGESLESHPYFAYHQTHIKVLAALMNALTKKTRAEEEFGRAVEIAKGIRSSCAGVAEGYPIEDNSELKELDGWLAWLRFYEMGQAGDKRFPHTRISAEEREAVENARKRITYLRGEVVEDAADVLGYWVMLKSEVQRVRQAYGTYRERVENLKGGSNIFDVAFGRAAERQNEFKRVQAALGQIDAAEGEPVREAELAVRRLELLTDRWMEAADRISAL